MGRETMRIGTMMGASWIHIVGFVLLVAGPSVVVASPNGPPASRTSAPAIGGIGAESSCTGCHGGNPVNSGGSIALTGAPAYYTPGQLYTITVELASTQNQGAGHQWGFELTAIKLTDGTGAGTFANVTGQGTTIMPGSGSYSTRAYICQLSAGLRLDIPSPATWQVEWTAPAGGTGPVAFYFTGMAANGADGADFDYVYTGSFSAQDVTPTLSTTWGRIKASYR